MLGRPRRPMNRTNDSKKSSVLSDSTSSKCTHLYTAQVYKTNQTFEPSFRNNGPAKSTPVTSNALAFLTWSSCSGDTGTSAVFVENLRHVTHPWITFRTARRP